MLIAYQVALEVVGELRPIVEQIRKHDATLAKQLVDAASSTVQNLAEGMGHRGGNRRLKWEVAFGEAGEVEGSLDLARAWGYVVDDRVAREKLGRLLALCWGLTKGGTSRLARARAAPAVDKP